METRCTQMGYQRGIRSGKYPEAGGRGVLLLEVLTLAIREQMGRVRVTAEDDSFSCDTAFLTNRLHGPALLATSDRLEPLNGRPRLERERRSGRGCWVECETEKGSAEFVGVDRSGATNVCADC